MNHIDIEQLAKIIDEAGFPAVLDAIGTIAREKSGEAFERDPQRSRSLGRLAAAAELLPKTELQT